MFTTLTEVKTFCQKKNIFMVDFMMSDLNGRWRHLSMPVDRLTEDTAKYGIGFDGSNYGFSAVENSDMVFIPDFSTAYADPFAEVPTLSMIGDVFVIDLPENRRFAQYPRNVALNAEEYLRSTGIADEIRLGPEYEFNVFDHMSYSLAAHNMGFSLDCEQAEWNSVREIDNLGYTVGKKLGYHIAPPQDRLAGFRSRVTMLLEDRGIKVKYHHHEVGGSGQQEIEVEFGGLLEMADKTMLAKYILKNAAVAEGKSVTFMPKPLHEEAGNGMHVHMHLFKNGQPLFYDEQGYAQLSQTALHFIGGLLTHINALCAITNPSTNSYKRLIPGFEAPVTTGYATANRSAVVRIPAYAKSPSHKRFELRNPDATCNPYYAYAAILMAGIDGINKQIDPHKMGFGPYDFNLYNLSAEEKSKIKSLPKSLDEALDALEADHDFLLAGGVFPEVLIKIWIANKRQETASYAKMPHPVEFARYYDL